MDCSNDGFRSEEGETKICNNKLVRKRKRPLRHHQYAELENEVAARARVFGISITCLGFSMRRSLTCLCGHKQSAYAQQQDDDLHLVAI